jgi:transcriptional regulator GlxA family with amidase domain
LYPGFELLDATGPVSVFNTANYILGQRAKSPAYGITMVSPTGRLVRSSSGIGVDTPLLSKLPPKNLHTFLVAGAEAGPLAKALKDPLIRQGASAFGSKAGRAHSRCKGSA